MSPGDESPEYNRHPIQRGRQYQLSPNSYLIGSGIVVIPLSANCSLGLRLSWGNCLAGGQKVQKELAVEHAACGPEKLESTAVFASESIVSRTW